MAATVERKGAGALEPHGMPEHDVVTPDKRVGLHEMPDITKEAPEVEYEQPKRSWLRYLAVGVTVGAVAIGAGLVISSVVTETAPEYTSAYSLAREHLAQTPGGFPVIQPDGTVISSEYSLAREHLAQTPGGFPVIQPDGTVGFPNAYSLAREHLAQTPGGFPVQ